MFDDIGGKLKGYACFMTIIEIILCIILSIVCFSNELYLLGVLAIIIGPILSWTSYCLLYAFGELVENSSIIASHFYTPEKRMSYKVRKSELNKHAGELNNPFSKN